MPPKEGSAPDLLPSAKEVVLGLLLLMMMMMSSPHPKINPRKSHEEDTRGGRCCVPVSYSRSVLTYAFLSKSGSIATDGFFAHDYHYEDLTASMNRACCVIPWENRGKRR